MKKYDLVHATFEERGNQLPGNLNDLLDWYEISCQRTGTFGGPCLAQFDTEEEARDALKSYSCSARLEQGAHCMLLLGDLYFVEANEYELIDGELEFMMGTDIVEYAQFEC